MNAVNKQLLRSLILLLGLVALPLTATAAFDWDIQHQGSANAFFEIEAFHTFVTNNSAVADTVTVNMVKNLPGDWVGSLCEEELCYPPFILDIELILAAGQTTELIIDITPITDLGKGSTFITLTSKNNPAEVITANFTVVSSELDVLYVSGLGNSTHDALVTSAITASGKSHAVWDLSEMGKASPVDLSQYETVIWGNGTSLQGFDAGDMTSISAYVAGGGHLLLSAQNLGLAFFDPISPFFDTTAQAWFQDTLGVDYTANLGGTVSVTSPPGDEIFGNSTYDINGGDGSNNNGSPDALAATGLGVTSLTFGGGASALIRTTQGAGKTAYASFGIEGIDDAAARSDFMAKVIAWFGSEVSAVGDDLPTLVRRATAWPNPFNPQTNIRFDVSGSRAQAAKVTIYDVSGRAVRHLFDGQAAPGANNVVWDGQNDRGDNLATGVYLALIHLAQDQQIVKMTLVK